MFFAAQSASLSARLKDHIPARNILVRLGQTEEAEATCRQWSLHAIAGARDWTMWSGRGAEKPPAPSGLDISPTAVDHSIGKSQPIPLTEQLKILLPRPGISPLLPEVQPFTRRYEGGGAVRLSLSRHLFICRPSALLALLAMLADGRKVRRQIARLERPQARHYKKWDTKPVPLDSDLATQYQERLSRWPVPGRALHVPADPIQANMVAQVVASLAHDELKALLAPSLDLQDHAFRRRALNLLREEAKRRRIRLGFPAGRPKDPQIEAQRNLERICGLWFTDCKLAAWRLQQAFRHQDHEDIRQALEADLQRYGRLRRSPQGENLDGLVAALAAVQDGS